MHMIQCADRAEWLKERRNGIGGSDAPAIMRLSPWSNPVELFQEKLGLAEVKEQSQAMRWGTLHEPTIRRVFEEDSGVKVDYFGAFAIAQSDTIPWMRASLDGLAPAHPEYGKTNIQIKTAHQAKKEQWDVAVPAEYQAQVQHEMAVAGVDHSLLVVLFGGNDLQWYHVPRNPLFQEEMLKQEEAFWLCVKNHEPPRPQTDDEMVSLARTLLNVTEGKTVRLDDSWMKRHQERLEALKVKKEAEAVLKRFSAELTVQAGDAEVVQFGDVEYSTKMQTRKAYQAKAAAFRVVRQVGGGGDE